MTPRQLASYVEPEKDGGYPIFAFGTSTLEFLSWPKEFQQEIIDLQNSSNRILAARVFRLGPQEIVQRLSN